VRSLDVKEVFVMDAKFRDRLGSVIMLAFIAILWASRSYTTPFGGIFPDAVMILMTVLVVVTLIRSFMSGREMEVESTQRESEKEEKHWLDMAVVMVILLLWVLLFRYLGFAIAGVVGFASIAWYTSGKRKDWKMMVKAVLVGMAVTFVLMAIFGYLLQVPLPEGEIFD
jgi:Na+/melibiose symporter-like transporter